MSMEPDFPTQPSSPSSGDSIGFASDFPRPFPRWALGAGIAGIALAFALLAVGSAEFTITNEILSALPLTEFFSTTEQIVGATGLVSVILVVALFDPPRRRALVVFLLALSLATVVNETIKRSTGRARPQYSITLDDKRERRLLDYIEQHPGTAVRVIRQDQWLLWRTPRPFFEDAFASFPSGHTNTAMVMLAFLLICYPRGRWLWVVLLLGCALARVRFRRHFPSDIFFGGATAWLIAHWVFSLRWPACVAARFFGPNGEPVALKRWRRAHES